MFRAFRQPHLMLHVFNWFFRYFELQWEYFANNSIFFCLSFAIFPDFFVILEMRSILILFKNKTWSPNLTTAGKVGNYLSNLTLAGNVTNYLSTWISLKLAERSEAKSSRRNFTSKYLKSWFITLPAFGFATLGHF